MLRLRCTNSKACSAASQTHSTYWTGHAGISGGAPIMRSMGRLVSWLSIRRLGVHLVLSWTDELYGIMTNGRRSSQSFLASLARVVSICMTVRLALSTKPSDFWLYGTVRVLLMWRSLQSSAIRSDSNSRPWSECRLLGTPKWLMNCSMIMSATVWAVWYLRA